MSKSMESPAQASTFLTHYSGRGLVNEDRCYAVERFKPIANGEIRRWPGEAPARRRRRIMAAAGRNPRSRALDEVRDMRPAHNEIIVCIGLGTRAGVQYWRSSACELWGDRKHRR